MLKYLNLHNVGPSSEMSLKFSSRLNLITGDNGLGKSFLLDVAWWALTRKWPHDLNPQLNSGYPAKPLDIKQPASIEFSVDGKVKDISYKSTYSPREAAWLGRSGRPWNPGLVIYAHADGGFSVWDPARNYWIPKVDIDVQERLPGYVFSEREVWDGLEVPINGKPTVVCNGLIRDWANWIREAGNDALRMEKVLEVLSPSDNPLDILKPGPLTRPFPNDVRDVPSIKMPYGSDVPIVHASSGVRRIVALAYMFMWCWKEHAIAAEGLGEKRTNQVILIIDEIESHLHPRWQRSILKSVLSLASIQHSTAKIQLIAATHSPLVLASAEPLFDAKKDSWFDLDLEISNNKKKTPVATLQKRPFVKHGDISNWLTSEAFDFKSARSKEAENAIEKARAFLLAGGTKLETALKINVELLAAGMSDIDPFWVRWGAFLEKLKP